MIDSLVQRATLSMHALASDNFKPYPFIWMGRKSVMYSIWWLLQVLEGI